MAYLCIFKEHLMNKEDLKNFYLAVILSALAVLAVNYFFPKPETQSLEAETLIAAADETAAANEQNVTDEAEQIFADVTETLQQDTRLPIKNANIKGSIRLKGARFDEIMLTKYKETIEDGSPDVRLFAPAKTAETFFADYGWLAADQTLRLPNKDTLWQVAEGGELTPQTPVTLIWRNGQGLTFKYVISLDENYLFNVRQTVENQSGHAVTLVPYGLLSKRASEEDMQRGIAHQGFTAILDDNLKEIIYNNIKDDGENFETTGGWISFADKYWFGAFIFDDNFKARINLRQVGENTYQLDYKGNPLEIRNGATADVDTRLYAGAKEIKLLDKYAENINKFDLAVDFGWY